MTRQSSNRQPDRQPPIGEIIKDRIGQGTSFGSREIVERSGATRQAVHRHLARLVREGVLVRQGQARAARYHAAAGATAAPAFERRYPTAGLREDAVWSDVAAALPALATATAANAHAVMAYALTEMVNNAIDHAGATSVLVRAGQDGATLWFEVEDAGTGAFERVRAALGLGDHLTALQEISKGKLTTAPDRHSGEGLFFTSKMGDRFELAANGLSWLVDNRRQDHAIGSAPAQPGTRVRFGVAVDARERPEDLFARYTHDLQFDTTRTVVKLFSYGVRFVSRSEAKRLLEGVERFRHVILDFAGVEAVGQGFADEVFRVCARAHPGVELRAESMSPPVAFMVGRVARAPAA
jgi:anti-sigma regulatory factor (Ser/Thr protein kinase)/uncharacterized protein (DUF1330 family)